MPNINTTLPVSAPGTKEESIWNNQPNYKTP